MRDAIAIFASAMTLVVLILVGCGFVSLILTSQKRTRTSQSEDEPKPVRCDLCGYDLRASQDRCPECGTKLPTAADRAISRGFVLDPEALQNDLPSTDIEPRLPAPEEKPVVAHSSRQWVEGELLVKQLRARGILAELRTGDGQLLPGSGLPNWAVTVSSRDAEVARAIIEHFRLKPSGDAANLPTIRTG